MEEAKEKTSENDSLSNLPFVASSAERPHDFGVLIDGLFYYWDARIDSGSRKLRKLRDRINKLITVISVIATVLLFVMFALSTFVLLPQSTWGNIAYWTTPSFEQLFFWLGVGGLMYIGYRHALSKKEPKETGDHEAHDTSLAQTTWESAQNMQSAKWVNIPSRCAVDTWSGLDSASKLAEQFKHPYVGIYHIFAGMLSESSVGNIFSRLNISFENVRDPLSKKLNEITQVVQGQSVASGIDALGQRTILGAVVHARSEGRTVITPVDMFISSYRNSEYLREVFYGIGIEYDAMENVLAWLQIREQMRSRWQAFRSASILKPTGNMNRSMTAVATPLLNQVSDDLTSMAVRGGLPLLVGREEEMARILRVFEGGGRSVVLVGPPGVGKQAMIDGIAELMVREDVPEMLQDKRLVSFDIGRLVAGATPAKAQERLLLALDEVAKSKNIALAILDIDDIVGISAGGADSLDLSSLLAREIEKGYFVLIATTTQDSYKTSIANSALGNVLTKVDIGEPDRNLSIKIVEAKVGRAEAEHSVIFSYQAVESAVELTGRFMHDAYLPQKAIEVVEEVALSVKQSRGVGATVTKEDVAVIVSSVSKVPLTAVTADEKSKLLTLETEMHKRVIGQDEAVNMVSSALRRARTELRSGSRPIANFLFLGPTGVGKTELAKTIASTYFGNENAMVRLDMSEYQAPGSIDRLLGTPGSGRGGIFTEAVRQQPFGLILLDELEKAHPDILNVFLQVFDDGRLTDAVGRTVDFTQNIIVATSNAGTSYIQTEIKKSTPMDQIKTHLIETELAQIYRPEFLNRFDGIVVFTPLTLEDVKAISRLMLAGVTARMEEKGMTLQITESAMQEIATAGYDPQFGARPLRRVIQERVEDKLATALLDGSLERRDTIILDAGGELRIEKALEL